MFGYLLIIVLSVNTRVISCNGYTNTALHTAQEWRATGDVMETYSGASLRACQRVCLLYHDCSGVNFITGATDTTCEVLMTATDIIANSASTYYFKASNCSAQPANTMNTRACGVGEITTEECQEKGCCFDERYEIQCYYPLQ